MDFSRPHIFNLKMFNLAILPMFHLSKHLSNTECHWMPQVINFFSIEQQNASFVKNNLVQKLCVLRIFSPRFTHIYSAISFSHSLFDSSTSLKTVLSNETLFQELPQNCTSFLHFSTFFSFIRWPVLQMFIFTVGSQRTLKNQRKNLEIKKIKKRKTMSSSLPNSYKTLSPQNI